MDYGLRDVILRKELECFSEYDKKDGTTADYVLDVPGLARDFLTGMGEKFIRCNICHLSSVTAQGCPRCLRHQCIEE